MDKGTRRYVVYAVAKSTGGPRQLSPGLASDRVEDTTEAVTLNLFDAKQPGKFCSIISNHFRTYMKYAQNSATIIGGRER